MILDSFYVVYSGAHVYINLKGEQKCHEYTKIILHMIFACVCQWVLLWTSPLNCTVVLTKLSLYFVSCLIVTQTV